MKLLEYMRTPLHALGKGLLLALMSGMLFAAGCNTQEGFEEDAEEAGEAIEDAVDDAGDAIEDAADDAKDAVD
jgi:predicted small secreted protein